MTTPLVRRELDAVLDSSAYFFSSGSSVVS